jgi:hypothetical protein
MFSSPSSSGRSAHALFLCTGTDSCASPDPSHSLFISCESLLNDCEISPLNRVYVREKARLAVHSLAENDTPPIPRTQNLNFVDQPPDRYGGDHGSHPLWLPQHLRDSVIVSEQHLIAEILVFLHANEVVQRVKA